MKDKRLNKKAKSEKSKPVQKDTEKAKLAITALTAARRKHRVEAIENLTDQQSLLDAALNDSSFEVRMAVAQRLTDQAKLAAFILNEHRPGVYRIACDKLTDQQTIANLALKVPIHISKYLIREILTDQMKLAGIAQSDPKAENRLEALKKLTDKQLLSNVLKKTVFLDKRVYLYSITKLRSEEIHACLMQLVKKSGSAEERKSVATRLIALLKTDEFAADLFWSDMARFYGKEYTDHKIINDHTDGSCGHIDYVHHTDVGLGVNFPPYPFND